MQKFYVVNRRIKYCFALCFFFSAISSFSQVSELNLLELKSCIPAKNVESITSIDQSYKTGVSIFNEVNTTNVADSQKVNKLINLFKLQVFAKIKLQEIWEQSDSLARENASKYFTEASKAYKALTDTINVVSPVFKSPNSAFIAVERLHQIILLQKFGIQVLFGCVRESSGKLSQPTDISGIVINIDMIERFRKVWNDSHFPMTYDQWTYTPTERKSFATQDYAGQYKDAHFVTKKEVTPRVDNSQDTLSQQNAVAINNGTGKTVSEGTERNVNHDSKEISGGKTNTSLSGGKSTLMAGNQTFSNIKGERNRLGINQNTQFEVKTLTSSSTIRTLGIDYFSIQIAASKNQLAREKLKKEIYCGNVDIEEKNENGWYKYLVGRFTSIDSANKFLSSPCILRGFVSGYNSKGRVAILSIKQPIVSSLGDQKYSIVYRIQIAASKQPLSRQTLSTVYKGYNPINQSLEDGWYRYSIGDFLYYGEAKAAKDSSGVKDAFVMPYQNGKRIQWPNKDALEVLKANQSANAIYVVQVAASKKPLPLQVIHDLIKIDYPLTMKFEDGWYKYFISAFTDITTAKEVAEKIGVHGAFIATYKNGLRVNP